MPLLGIDHIQLAAPPGCEAAGRRFFGELLALPEIEKPPALRARGGCWFRVGAHQLHIGVEQDFRPSLKAHPAFAVAPSDLDEIFARLQAAGVSCQWDTALNGLRRFYAQDPWGNRLEFTAPTSG